MLPSRSRLKPLICALQGIGLVARYAMEFKWREVWITFDDDFHPVHTTSIIGALRHHNVSATFFWKGQQAERHPDIACRAVDEGHRIGNHSYSHPFLTRLDRGAIRREIMRTGEVLAPYYYGPKLDRPPHGDHDDRVDK
jgi:peptidoglycan-N-acetylglucosamine deacetylase